MAMLRAKRKEAAARAPFTKCGARALREPRALRDGGEPAPADPAAPVGAMFLFRADVTAAAWIFKAADRLGQKQLWQIEHDVRRQDREGDGGKEHHVNGQGGEHGPTER